METTAFITLDLQRLTYNRIRAKQNDTWRRRVNITVLSDGREVNVAGSSEFVVQYRKPDGTKGFYTHLPDGTVACTSVLNDIDMTMAPQMLTVAGEVSCSIAMLDQNHQILQTFSFFIDVEESESAGATSDDYLNAPTLQNLVNLTQDVLNNLGDISELKTSDKTSTVAAINEIFTLLGSSQSSIDEAIELLSEKVNKSVKRINGVEPNAAGGLFLEGKNIPAFPANIPDFTGNVEEALNRLASEVFSPELSGWRSALDDYSDEGDVIGLPILDTVAEKYGKMAITGTDDEMGGERNFFEVPTVASAKAMIREAIRMGYIDVTKEYEEALEYGDVGSVKEYLWTLPGGRYFVVDPQGLDERFYLQVFTGGQDIVTARVLHTVSDFDFVEFYGGTSVEGYEAVPTLRIEGDSGDIYQRGALLATTDYVDRLIGSLEEKVDALREMLRNGLQSE